MYDRSNSRCLENAHARVRFKSLSSQNSQLAVGDLVRVSGSYDGVVFKAVEVECVRRGEPGRELHEEGFVARSELYQMIRRHFDRESFQEVETPNWVRSPGVDVYLEPVRADFSNGVDRTRHWLHTSPEFSMKQMLVDGFERIFQIAKVYRNGEVGPLHNPEFTILEWYRAWEGYDAILRDLEAICTGLPGVDGPFDRITMHELFEKCVGIDILAEDTSEKLAEACRREGVLNPPAGRTWDDIFFELMVTHIDAYLRTCGAVVVTHWPVSQAALARRCDQDPRVALRFELYVGGVELANGFEELTDPVEQRKRFEEDRRRRASQGLPDLPMPVGFLRALERGMPPSSGVAVGLDRILMLKLGADTLDAALPFGWHSGVRV